MSVRREGARESNRKPGSSTASSAIAASGTGLAGSRAVATGRSAIDRPCRAAIRAATCPLAVAPLAEAHRDAGEGLDDVDVGRRVDRTVEVGAHDFLAAADDRLGRR